MTESILCAGIYVLLMQKYKKVFIYLVRAFV